MKTLLIPLRNKRDLEDVPAAVRQELEFIFVDDVREAVGHTLQCESSPPPA